MTSSNSRLPELPYQDWETSKATLHLVSQVVGKVRLVRHPKLNHWWHATLFVTPEGFSTHTIPTMTGSFEIRIDLQQHRIVVLTSAGFCESFGLPGESIADVYHKLLALLEKAGYPTKIVAQPYDNPHSKIRFNNDTQHREWDREAIEKYWRALTWIDAVFKEFAGWSYGKTSPVQLFWHSFDLAVTRFSGRMAPPMDGGRRSDIEAYSHEVISFGFWPGDPNTPMPAFYTYTAPEPETLTETPLKPDVAWWQDVGGSHLGLLKYEDVRNADNPREMLLDFMESGYQIGCQCANWDETPQLETRRVWEKLDRQFGSSRT